MGPKKKAAKKPKKKAAKKPKKKIVSGVLAPVTKMQLNVVSGDYKTTNGNLSFKRLGEWNTGFGVPAMTADKGKTASKLQIVWKQAKGQTANLKFKTAGMG